MLGTLDRKYDLTLEVCLCMEFVEYVYEVLVSNMRTLLYYYQ